MPQLQLSETHDLPNLSTTQHLIARTWVRLRVINIYTCELFCSIRFDAWLQRINSFVRYANKQISSLTLSVAPAGKSTGKADQYLRGQLDRADLVDDPFAQFHSWYSHAKENVHQPETVCLSTASLPSGAPSSRFVYLKELDSRGFVIYSNWDTSRKAADIESNPQASLAFWWHELERQIRVEGSTERLSREESQRYFDVRARGSQIGAWASPQSSVLKGREELEQKVKAVEERFEGKNIEVPDFWGGLRIVPSMIEFWQGRDSRLHDRFKYTREGEIWKIDRLSP